MCEGDPLSVIGEKIPDWLFPACAGVILIFMWYTIYSETFPRMCGGDPICFIPVVLPERLFPACAGVIRIIIYH